MGGPHGPGRHGARSRGAAGRAPGRSEPDRTVRRARGPPRPPRRRDPRLRARRLRGRPRARRPRRPRQPVPAAAVARGRGRRDVALGVTTSPGRSKRTYLLTDEGRQLLDSSGRVLRTTDTMITPAFLRRYEKKEPTDEPRPSRPPPLRPRPPPHPPGSSRRPAPPGWSALRRRRDPGRAAAATSRRPPPTSPSGSSASRHVQEHEAPAAPDGGTEPRSDPRPRSNPPSMGRSTPLYAGGSTHARVVGR